ncbi:hypothetical protein EVAR_65469_1 [Eumeta japonica]|uniref:Uncharacterized protein n=1 Tax=Eumeta variegata TaxID=151549 RepID=A0A4C1YWK7_EUMVA|nr:hypothetical protein EVAR_65469_1 [Eumeta japonica]
MYCVSVSLLQCVALRAEVLEKMDEISSNRQQLAEVLDRVRQLEMKLEGFSQKAGVAMPAREQEGLREERARLLEDQLAETRRELSDVCAINNIQQTALVSTTSILSSAELKAIERERLLHCMQVDNTRIRYQINQEIMRVKLKFQEQMQQLEPLPDLLRATEARLKVAYQKQAEAEHNTESLARELNSVRDKLVKLSQKPPPEQIKPNDDEERLNSVVQRVQQATATKAALETEIKRLTMESERIAEAVVLSDNRILEKEEEFNTLTDKLERARVRTTRSVKNAERRVDVIRECFKSKVDQLERQLVEVRARLTTVEKERDELQSRLQGQVVQLSLSLQQAEHRISGLQAQVSRLQPQPTTANRKCTCAA